MRRLALPLLLVAALALLPCATATAALARIGRAPALPAGTVSVARLAPGRPLRITVALKPRDPAALARFAQAVSEPSSPDYGRFLTPAQFARRFAPPRASVTAVDAALRARGLTPGRLSANGLSIPLRASAGAVERAFATTLADVRLPRGGEAVLNTVAPAIDATARADVQAVIGLDSLGAPFSNRIPTSPQVRPARAGAHLDTGGPRPCAAAVREGPAQSGYTSDQIAAAYGLSGLYAAGDEGAGVTIAAYELESDDPADIAAYQACYGTDTSISYVSVDGGVRPGPGTGEAALDIEQLVSLAPKARLIVYQAPNSNSNGPGAGPYDLLSAIVSQDRASVISDSWGQCEPEEGRVDAAAENVLFEEAAIQGQTVLASSGDSGSEDCFNAGTHRGSQSLEVDDPASQPFVTGVGGTSLTAIGPPPAEVDWNQGLDAASLLAGSGAGGGGISSFWPMPSYQAGAAAILQVTGKLSSGAPCGAAAGLCREVPDVAADADPEHGYLIYYNGSGAKSDAPSGWQGTGGTSGAAPLWAAVIALADADPSCGGAPIGFANPALYQLAGVSQATYFHEITSGDNDLTGGAGGLYPATPGYNMATGLGSPNAAALAPALCSVTLRLAGPRSELTFAPARARFRLRVGTPAGSTARYAVRGLPRGVAFDPATGEITGLVRRIGRYRVRIEVTDSSGTRRTLRFRWIVAGRPKLLAATLAAPTGAAPTLSLTVRAGRDEPGLRMLSLRLPAAIRSSGTSADVSVTGAGAGTLRHTISLRGGVLHVRLRAPSAEVRVVCGSGLQGGGTGSGSGGSHARLRPSHLELTVHSVDAGRGTLTLTAPVRLLS